MSTSAVSKKNRKDFGFAANVATSVGLPSEDTSLNIQENAETTNTIMPDNSREISGTEKPATIEPVEVKKIPEIDFSEEEKPEGKSNDDIDKLLSLSRNTHGVQKSIYLDEDIYLYIKDKCDKNKAKFSVVINLLLRKYINSQK